MSFTARKPTRSKIIGGTIDSDTANEKKAMIKFYSEQINTNKDKPDFADKIKKWQDYINKNQPLLNEYNAEEEAHDRAFKNAEERRVKADEEKKLMNEGPTIRNSQGVLEKAYVSPGWKPGDPIFSGWISPEKYYEKFTSELRKIPGITDDLINKIVNFSQEASPYKVETQKNPNPKVKRTLSEIEFMNQPWADKWLTSKEKITLVVQAIQDPVVAHERLGQIYDAVHINKEPGILHEQSDERIKQAISDEITDPGAIIRLRQQVFHEKYDPKGIDKVAQDFTDGLSKAIDYISPIVSFIPGIGPAISAGLDVANFGYQFYQSGRDAQDQGIDNRYIEEQNTSFGKYYEEVPEDEESEPQEEHHSDELEGGKIKSHLIARQTRQKRFRSIKPILSGTKRMEWLKRTVPINQVPIT